MKKETKEETLIPTYNEAYSKLGEILTLLDEDNVDVDELSEKVKEASELLKFCKERLLIANEETRKMLENL
ncbi:MAG: exodeoxyribonuclease VII small subunit [Dysgonamonadaceae bacterium]|jgi:exodeoxyribonuclease VII small subunit|nr:exodeoxyribonuclease VII small subunit [Dysgonamonadaceae bacterium]